MNIPQIKMRTIVLLLFLIATTCGAGVGIAFGLASRSVASLELDWSGVAPQAHVRAETANLQSQSVNSLKQVKTLRPLFAFLDEVLQKLPPGTQLDASQFDSVLGVDAGNYLRRAQMAKIAVKADLVSVTLVQPRQVNLNGQADLRVAQKVTFHLSTRKDKSGGSIHLNRITGVEVRVSWLLGFLDVSQIDITGSANGDTSLVVTVDTLLGKKSRSFTIGADGKPKAPSP